MAIIWLFCRPRQSLTCFLWPHARPCHRCTDFSTCQLQPQLGLNLQLATSDSRLQQQQQQRQHWQQLQRWWSNQTLGRSVDDDGRWWCCCCCCQCWWWPLKRVLAALPKLAAKWFALHCAWHIFIGKAKRSIWTTFLRHSALTNVDKGHQLRELTGPVMVKQKSVPHSPWRPWPNMV